MIIVMRDRASLKFKLFLIVGDALAVVGAYVLAYVIRVKISDVPTADVVLARPYLYAVLTLLPFVIIWFSLIGTYRSVPQKVLAQAGRLLSGALGAMLFMVTVDYFSNQPIFPAKLVPIYGLIFSVIFLCVARGTLYLLRYLRQRKNLGEYQYVMIVGSNSTAKDIVDYVSQQNNNYKIHSVIGDGRMKFTTHRDIASAIRSHNPNIIIQVATADQPVIDRDLLEYAQKNFVEFKFVPSEISDLPERVELELFMDGIPMMSVQQTALLGWGRVFKRGFDIIVSLIALIILSPILLVIAIINKLVIGKVFFHQTRITRGNQPFELYKFQTVINAYNGLTPEEGFRKMGRPELIKPYRDGGDQLPNDPRYGAWGNFARKTSIDELPQLFNVLIGDISLVGPRALIPQEINAYEKKHAILNVKSGITGLAQVSGRRDLPWEQRRKLDVYYVQNWSFLLDIQILLKTAWQVIADRSNT